MNAEFLHLCGYDVSEGQTPVTLEENPMRIKCPECGEKAPVGSRSNTSAELATVYARCKNPECKRFDHTLVAHVSFSHWICPKEAAVQMTLADLFDKLPAASRREMAAELAARA